jgi:hypothetical protein
MGRKLFSAAHRSIGKVISGFAPPVTGDNCGCFGLRKDASRASISAQVKAPTSIPSRDNGLAIPISLTCAVPWEGLG